MLVANDGTLDSKLCDLLAAAADRGMRVIVELPSEDARDRVEAEVPSANATVTALAGDPAEIDRWSVLISAVTDETLPERRTETTIWASGPDHGLVVGVHHLLGTRIDDSDAAD